MAWKSSSSRYLRITLHAGCSLFQLRDANFTLHSNTFSVIHHFIMLLTAQYGHADKSLWIPTTVHFITDTEICYWSWSYYYRERRCVKCSIPNLGLNLSKLWFYLSILTPSAPVLEMTIRVLSEISALKVGFWMSPSRDRKDWTKAYLVYQLWLVKVNTEVNSKVFPSTGLGGP
jgi:hypothetical protein